MLGRFLDHLQQLVGTGVVHLFRQPDNHDLVGSFIDLEVQFADDLVALFGVDDSLCIFSPDEAQPLVKVEVAVLRQKLAPLWQVFVTHLRLDHGEDKVQVRVSQLIKLVTGGTFAAGIFGTAVRTVEIASVGDSQWQLSHPFGTVKNAGMGYQPLLHGVDEMLFYIVEPYDIAEVHQ